MATTLTPKENYLRIINGEMPEWVPMFEMFGGEYTAMTGPMGLFANFRGPEGGTDPWGVKYVTNEETGWAALPEPGNFILEDITKWHEVIKKPAVNFEDIDWELMSKRDIEAGKVDYENKVVSCGSSFSPFQDLMSFMGFSEGLLTYFTEPDSVHELYDFMCSYWEPFIAATVEWYKPHMYGIGDDSASKYAPFISPAMYHEFLYPYYKRIFKPAVDRGLPISFHNCGRCEDYIDDMIDLGVKQWDPAQRENDLVGIKEKYKGKLTIAGGWEFKVPLTWPEVDEEEVRQSVRDVIDELAPGGGFLFGGGVLGQAGDELVMKINGWVRDEGQKYGKTFYTKSQH